MLSVTGTPYDTLHTPIFGNGVGSLADFGIAYSDISLLNGKIDYISLGKKLADKSIKVVYAQRSRGYTERESLSSAELSDLSAFVKKHSSAYVVIDNCYGEFTETSEPDGADLLIGSLIKNPGGGLADCGGYLAGSAEAVELAAFRLTAPGLGGECGASVGLNKNFYRGFFYAPHTVAQALKTACFAAYMLEKLGYETTPRYDAPRYDIVQSVKLKTPEALKAFCRGIQKGSPIDSRVTPEPWAMPGYADEVIMAAGTFVGGASIELSCDGPLRPPYMAYFQGGLTYEAGKYGILRALEELTN
jgi:cystathionine beta-lyase family protein involved in aluminum resistance